MAQAVLLYIQPFHLQLMAVRQQARYLLNKHGSGLFSDSSPSVMMAFIGTRKNGGLLGWLSNLKSCRYNGQTFVNLEHPKFTKLPQSSFITHVRISPSAFSMDATGTCTVGEAKMISKPRVPTEHATPLKRLRFYIHHLHPSPSIVLHHHHHNHHHHHHHSSSQPSPPPYHSLIKRPSKIVSHRSTSPQKTSKDISFRHGANLIRNPIVNFFSQFFRLRRITFQDRPWFQPATGNGWSALRSSLKPVWDGWKGKKTWVNSWLTLGNMKWYWKGFVHSQPQNPKMVNLCYLNTWDG